MKILFIAPRLPVPADTGGKIRALNILKEIAKFAQVRLVCFSFEKDDVSQAKGLEALGIITTLVPIKEPNLIRKVSAVAFEHAPYSISKYDLKVMTAALKQLVGSQKFDCVHIDHLHMATYIACFSGMPAVLDEHNVEFKILERCGLVEKNLIKRLIYRNQTKKMRNFEEQTVSKFKAVLAVSKDDKDILDSISGFNAHVDVVPNGVDTEFFKSGQCLVTSDQLYQLEAARHQPPVTSHNTAVTSHQPLVTSHQSKDSLVFTGSMDWLPNDDSAIYFIKEIMPLIWQMRSDVKFYVVGKNPSGQLKQLGQEDERIIVTGGVPDVRPFMERSKVFVVPLRIGGGTRLKILEAMSMNMAVVSTSIGAEGIAYTKNKDIVLSDDPRSFAKSVVELLDDPLRRKSIGEEGRRLVCERYDWNVVGHHLKIIYERISSGK